MSKFTFETFKNESGLKFKNIEGESFRTYVFPDWDIDIINPVALNVSKSGGHRIFDADGRSHYIPKGWIHLQWAVKDGKPHFVT